jgi:hypothetical protein
MKISATFLAGFGVAILAATTVQADAPSVEDFKAAVPGRVAKGTTERGIPWTTTYKPDGKAEREVEINLAGGIRRPVRTSGTWEAKAGGILCTTWPPEPNIPGSAGSQTCSRWEKDGNTLHLLGRDGQRAGEALAIRKIGP